MQVTWRPPTATTAHSCSDINRHRHHSSSSSSSDEENGIIRSWGHITLCKLRDSIIRGPALSRSWASAITSRRSSHHYPHGHPSVTLQQQQWQTPPTSASSSSSPGGRKRLVAMSLTDLPYTIFAEIVSYLSAREAVAARRISRDVCAALTRDELSISLLLLHFPRARESRELKDLLQRVGHGADADAVTAQLEGIRWADALAATARRYHHLSTATPFRTRSVPVLRDEDAGELLRGVTPWNRFLRLDDKTAAFHYWDPTWACDAGAGLLVYPAAKGRVYLLQDIGSGRTWTVPFETEGRIVRRTRLSHGILIFEWCERQAMHALNDDEEEELAHRHFATAYDVKRAGEGSDEGLYTLRTYGKDRGGASEKRARDEWEVTFRSEWKIHYLGLLLSHQDRFFSTHNSTHYVVYIWQPTRSPWGEDAPLERLIVWQLGEPDPYRPSLDPCASTTDDDGGAGAFAPGSGRGPRIVARLTNEQLDHWGLRQHDTPSLRGLALDDCTWDRSTASATGHVFFVEEEHRWSAGPHSSPTPPRLHHVKATGIPLAAAEGPRWVDECGQRGSDPSQQMQFCWRASREARLRGNSAVVSTTAPSAPRMETWPGRCPCWRHDDFPYLTVCEVNDVGAGVRFSARHCFMLETLSVNVKPRLRIHGVERADVPSRRGSSSSSSSSSSSGSSTNRGRGRDARRTANGSEGEDKNRRAPPPPRASRARAEDGRSGSSAVESRGTSVNSEIQFADEAWARLLGAGYICGDERWLIGQDAAGDITIMHF